MTAPRESRSSPSSASNENDRRALQIERLLQPPRIQDLSYRALKTVAAMRLVAVYRRAGHDPLLELAQRFSSITGARAVLDFAQVVATSWPEDVMVMRPCCRIVSPDELTLAQITDAALGGDRAAFGEVLHGLVRQDRHDRLFDHAVRMVAEMH